MSTVSSVLLLLLISVAVTFAWAPPFISFLYKQGLRRQKEKHKPVYRYLQIEKAGVPSMGGLLIIASVLVLTFLLIPLTPPIVGILLSMALFSILGGFDDLKKLIFVVERFWGLRRRYIFLIQWLLGGAVAWYLYTIVGVDTVSSPILIGPASISMGAWFIAYAAFLIVATSNSFNITDGIDGLSAGLLVIALTAFLILALVQGEVAIAQFIAVWLGSLLVYLYFNITPARFMMGDVGAQPFGAMLAVIALLLDQSLLLLVIGGMFYIEGASSGIQILSRHFRNGKKVFTIAPLHYHFQVKRWSEGKICMRFWLFGALFAYIGLMIGLWGV